MDTNDADLADGSAFESQYSPDNDSVYSTQASILSLHGSTCSDGPNYGPSLPSSPPKVQRKCCFIYGRTSCVICQRSLCIESCRNSMLETLCFSCHGVIIRLKCSFMRQCWLGNFWSPRGYLILGPVIQRDRHKGSNLWDFCVKKKKNVFLKLCF